MFRDWSLKNKFVTIFVALITLPTILFGILIYYQATEAFTKQAVDFTKSRLERNDENLNSILRGIENMSSYMIYDDNFRTFFRTSRDDIQELRHSEEIIRGYFTFELMTYEYIDSIKLIGENKNSLMFGNPVSANETILKNNAVNRDGAPYWSSTYKVDSDWSGENSVVSLTRVINDLNNASNRIGYTIIRLDAKKLYSTVEVDISQQGDYFVITDKGEIVLHPDSSLIGKSFPDKDVANLIVSSEKESLSYQTNDNTFLIEKSKIRGTNWISVAMVDRDEVVQSLYNVRSVIVNMVILLGVLGIFAFIGFYLWHVKPIVKLTEQTKQLEKGDFTAKVPINSRDEIGQLSWRFNNMVQTIQKYIDIEYKLKIKQRESELKALQSQIDPHFLYNTLDMIRWTARIEKAPETGLLIERLSKIFRMNLNMGKMWISLEEEIIYIQNYLELQKSRMGERLEFTIFFDEQAKDAYIIKQLIQPLVENSILHGFKDLPRTGKIYIRFYQVGNHLWIDVIDNGWGFKGKDNAINPSNSGYALSNLKERMRIAFGQEYGLEQMKVEEGTWIRIKLPLLHKDDISSNFKELGE